MRRELLVHGLRAAILNNASAYGFSVMITTVLAATQTILQPPELLELFLYAGGTTIAFAAVEAAVTSGFRVRARPEPSDVVAAGTALATLSVLLALGAGVGVAQLTGGRLGWALTPFAATVTYSTASGVEMALGRRKQERREQETEAEAEASSPPGGDDVADAGASAETQDAS